MENWENEKTMLVEVRMTQAEYESRLACGDERHIAYIIHFTDNHAEFICEPDLHQVVQDAAEAVQMDEPNPWDPWNAPTAERRDMLALAAKHWHPRSRDDESHWHGSEDAARRMLLWARQYELRNTGGNSNTPTPPVNP